MKRLAIGIAMTAALVACSGSGGTPQAAAEEFLRKMSTGDCEGLREYISANGRELVGPKIEQGCGMAKTERDKDPAKAQKEGLKEVHVVEAKEEGDKATLKIEPERNDGRREPAGTFVMVKEEGRWRIDLLATGQAMGAGMGPGPGTEPQMPTPPAAAPQPAPAPAK
jgi:hypothetical protein